MTSRGEHGAAARGAGIEPEGGRDSHDRIEPEGGRDSHDRIESDVHAIWCGVLGRGEIERTADFFGLGGDSLRAMRMIRAVQDRFGVEVPVEVFAAQVSVRSLARQVEALVRGTAGADRGPREREEARRGDGGRSGLPLTIMQEAYWVGELGALPLSIGARYYFEVVVRPYVDGRLERVLEDLQARHGVLRSIIDPAGELRMRADAAPPAFATHVAPAREASRVRDEVRARMLSRGRRASTSAPFDLEVTRDPNGACLHFDVSLWAFDGDSVRLFLDELLRGMATPESAPPPMPVDDPAYLQQIALRGDPERRARAWRYWEARLPDFPSAPAVPLVRSAAEVGPPRFARRSFTLDAARARGLREHARAAGVSPTFAACTAYAEIVGRWAGTRHFALTVLHSDRPSAADGAGVLGNFSRTSLLEVDLRDHGTFAGRARALQARFWRDLEHADVSGLEVSRELSKRRGLAGSAPFPVTFTFVPSLTPQLPGRPFEVSLDHRRCHLEVPQVYLDHQVCEGPSGELTFNWDYVLDLFDAGLVDTMFAAYERRVGLLAEDAEAWHREAPPRLIGSAPSPARAPSDPPGRLHDGFLRQVAAHPRRPAVITPHAQLSYGEVYRRAVQLADGLASSGVRPGELVAVVAEKGWEQVVAVLGVLFAGGAYVPVDPELPQARRELLLEQAGVRIAVTSAALDETLAWPATVARLAVTRGECAPVEPRAVALQAASDLAYVIFTSGTTGTPKGVMIEHGAALNTLRDIDRRIALDERDRVFGISSLSFDLSVYDIFGTLGAGAALVLPDASQRREPAHWRQLLAEHGVTIWSSVPALVELLEESARLAGGGLSELRVVMMSGDWIPVTLPRRLRELRPGVRVLSLGGATEASIWSNFFEVGEVDPTWRSIPYGRALAGQSMHVLDEALDVCPPLVTGAIYIGGVGLARGYLADPQRTEAVFVRHPVTGERLYRTGDLGRYRPDGEIELLGREDHQVKIQGYRVECSEIEAQLFSILDLRAAVVTAVGDARGAKRLVAYLAPAIWEARPSEHAVAEALRRVLPSYMVPSAIVWCEALPLTANGKVDRARLPAPSAVAAPDRSGLRPARDAVEQRLAALWCELLELPEIGIDDDFFDRGGTSFAGMRLMARIAADFGRRVELAALIQRPTIAQLAELLREARPPDLLRPLVRLRDGGAPALVCIHPVGGSVLCYLDLARRMPAGSSVLGVQAPALAGGEVFADIPSMAGAYLLRVRAEQPEGPYYLCGWSLGGVVAYEMARQLRAAGARVDLLAMIDSRLPGSAGSPADWTPAGWMSRFVQDVMAVDGRTARLDPAALAGADDIALAERALAVLSAHGANPFGSAAELRTTFGAFSANLRALQRYEPGRYEGPVELFLADRDGAGRAQVLAWERVAPRVRAVLLAADHYSIMRGEALHRIAAEIASALGARGGGGSCR